MKLSFRAAGLVGSKSPWRQAPPQAPAHAENLHGTPVRRRRPGTDEDDYHVGSTGRGQAGKGGEEDDFDLDPLEDLDLEQGPLLDRCPPAPALQGRTHPHATGSAGEGGQVPQLHGAVAAHGHGAASSAAARTAAGAHRKPIPASRGHLPSQAGTPGLGLEPQGEVPCLPDAPPCSWEPSRACRPSRHDRCTAGSWTLCGGRGAGTGGGTPSSCRGTRGRPTCRRR